MNVPTKKRLGQYYSSEKVAELLASLCALTGDESVIDPMAGIGNMLSAAIKFGVQPTKVYGIEIDSNAAHICNEKIPGSRVLVGDAFSKTSYESLGDTSWNAVITNPPYVRYQSLSKASSVSDGIVLKDSTEVRSSLTQIVDALPHLTDEEKACFKRIIKHYSGLSDLAVPSWLLCAALVKHGGVLAMVVPESWMNRDYALSIKYMLLKFFDIQYIVEDVDAAWFSEALVKTNLIVARRIEFRRDYLNARAKTYKHIKLSATLVGESSLVDGLSNFSKKGIEALHDFISLDNTMEGAESKSIPTSDFISAMQASSAFGRLIKKLEPSIKHKDMISIPSEIHEVMHYDIFQSCMATLLNWGFQVGQGLRTGANKFFYAEFSGSDDGGVELLRVDGLLGGGVIAVAQKNVLPALRYQADANDRYFVTSDMLPHRLIYVQKDLFDNNNSLRDTVDGQLADHIAAANAATFIHGGSITRFRDLSAVKPNIRTSGQIRHWYMLPPLANRHLPHLCISRVNNKSPRCLLVDNGVVVDANFSVLWTEPKEEQIIYAVFALMNSSWVRACLESAATVMGGGALKVEASHIRSLPIPPLTDRLLSSLSLLGKQLRNDDIICSNEIIYEINKVVLNCGFGISNATLHSKKLDNYVATKERARKRRGNNK